MDPLLRMTMIVTHLSRRRWSRAQALVALCTGLVIGVIDKLGCWPDALRAEHARRGPLRP